MKTVVELCKKYSKSTHSYNISYSIKFPQTLVSDALEEELPFPSRKILSTRNFNVKACKMEIKYYQNFCLSACLSICLSVSVCLSVCLSVSLSLSLSLSENATAALSYSQRISQIMPTSIPCSFHSISFLFRFFFHVSLKFCLPTDSVTVIITKRCRHRFSQLWLSGQRHSDMLHDARASSPLPLHLLPPFPIRYPSTTALSLSLTAPPPPLPKFLKSPPPFFLCSSPTQSFCPSGEFSQIPLNIFLSQQKPVQNSPTVSHPPVKVITNVFSEGHEGEPNLAVILFHCALILAILQHSLFPSTAGLIPKHFQCPENL